MVEVARGAITLGQLHQDLVEDGAKLFVEEAVESERDPVRARTGIVRVTD